MRFVYVLFLLLFSCGQREELQDRNSSETYDVLVSTAMPRDVMLEKQTQSILPIMQKDMATLVDLTITFEIKVDKEKAKLFSYNRNYWKVAFESVDNADLNSAMEYGTVQSLGTEKLDGLDTMSVQLKVTLSGDNFTKIRELIKDDSYGRQALKIVATYWNDPADTASTETSKKVYSLIWQSDIGVIKEAPTMLTPQVEDTIFIARWEPPKTTTTLLNKSNVLVESGTSSLAYYLLVYWNVSECNAENAWKFKPNINVVGSDQPELSCDISSPASNANGQAGLMLTPDVCNLGCATTASDVPTLTLENTAIPVTIPAGLDEVKIGCMSVRKVLHRANAEIMSHTITDLTNDNKYGMMVYNVDSAGHISLGRSACAFATPEFIPLASDMKNAGAKKQKSDCFIATAASGSESSKTVTYWRIVRDTYLRGTDFVNWYYSKSPKMASWLNDHPSLKPYVNFILEKTGYTLVSSYKIWFKITKGFSRAFSNTAYGATDYSDKTDSKILDFESQRINSDVSFYGGTTAFTTDKSIWNRFYTKNNKVENPYFLGISQVTSVLWLNCVDFGIGGLFNYFSVSGKEQDETLIARGKSPADARTTVMFSLVGQVLLQGRIDLFRIASLRASSGAGMAYMREEIERSAAPKNTASSGSSPALGYTFWKPVVSASAALDVNIGHYFPDELVSSHFSLGVIDVGVFAYTQYIKDLSKSISLDLISYGGGVNFLFN